MKMNVRKRQSMVVARKTTLNAPYVKNLDMPRSTKRHITTPYWVIERPVYGEDKTSPRLKQGKHPKVRPLDL